MTAKSRHLQNCWYQGGKRFFFIWKTFSLTTLSASLLTKHVHFTKHESFSSKLSTQKSNSANIKIWMQVQNYSFYIKWPLLTDSIWILHSWTSFKRMQKVSTKWSSLFRAQMVIHLPIAVIRIAVIFIQKIFKIVEKLARKWCATAYHSIYCRAVLSSWARNYSPRF